MQVLRKQILEVKKFEVGDQIEVGKYTATCQKIDGEKAVFLLDQYLDKAYSMNDTDTNRGGYRQSRLRNDIKDADMDENFVSIREHLIPYDNGDLLRLATVDEMFGGNDCFDSDDSEQWELMKDRRNRIADRKGEKYEWGWLQNIVKNSSAYFALVNYYGDAGCNSASSSFGVRPVFRLAKEKSGDLVSHGNGVLSHSGKYPWGCNKSKDNCSKEALLDKGTSEVKALMDSYIRVGFTKEQAFRIILTTIETNVKK